MRLISTALVISLFSIGVVACGDNGGGADADPFDTYQACFDEHHTTESLPTQEAIVICCLDHPIAGVKPACGADATTCSTYLGTNLSAASATATEVSTACADYVTQKNM